MITLVFCGDLRYCPYIKRYTERLDQKAAEYEVLFWNRAGLELNLPRNYYYYNSPSAESLSKSRKLFDFLGFRKWIKNHLKTHHSDGIILLSTLTAVLLYPDLKKYRNRYVFDIRDYSYENIGFFRLIEEKIIKNSYFTAISSKGFQAFLPEYAYVIAHNFNRNEMITEPSMKERDLPIRLVWNGTVRFFDFQKKYIDALKNDSRFVMVYHGAGTDLQRYRDYCQENGVENVVFTGPYDNKDKQKLLADADMLNNCYGGSSGDELRYAVSNRYYDGLIYHIPQLVEPDGYKASITGESQVGIALEATESLADELYAYYMNIDKEKFDTSCSLALDRILQEDDMYIQKIDEFIEKVS